MACSSKDGNRLLILNDYVVLDGSIWKSIFMLSIFMLCALRIVDAMKKKAVTPILEDLRTKFFILVFINGGLFLVDQIHFQYNGFLFGVLLFSIAKILEVRFGKCVLKSMTSVWSEMRLCYCFRRTNSFKELCCLRFC